MKKILIALLVVAVAVASCIALIGCKDEEKKDEFIVATNAAFPPFEYKEGNKFVGVDMELAQKIADKLGKTLVVKDMDFDGVILSVASGESHVGMAGMTITDKRKETVDFCNPYYNASQMLIVPENDTTFDGLTTAAQIEEKLKSMSGVTIGVQRGTTGNYYVKGDADWGFDGFANVTCKEYDNGGLAVKDIQNGQCNYVVIDEMPAKQIVETSNIVNSSKKVKVISVPLTEEEYAFAVAKGNTELKNQINSIMEELKKDGTFQAILDKYFAAE